MRSFIFLLAALPLFAQPKKLTDAQLQTRAVSGDLARTLQSLAATQPQPAWAAYTVPAAPIHGNGCNGGVIHLEPPREMMVLFRFHENQITQIRTFAPDCEMSAAGAPFYWLTGVEPSASVATLATFVKPGARLSTAALNAIGHHAAPAAEAALLKLLARGQPESTRSSAVRCIRNPAILKTVLASDPSDRVRKNAISALRSVPGGAGIPMLIEAAKTHRDPAIRKHAMSVLGQSKDPRATAFFEELLR